MQFECQQVFHSQGAADSSCTKDVPLKNANKIRFENPFLFNGTAQEISGHTGVIRRVVWGRSGPFGGHFGSFGSRSGAVPGSFGGRFGVDGGRSGPFQGHSGVVRDSFGGRSAVVRGSFENFSIFVFGKNKKSIVSEIY